MSRTRSHVSRTGRIRVLVADDHVTVLEGVAAIIGRQVDMAVVAEADNGREAVERWREVRPDIALLDLRMPVLDGVGAIEEVRRADPSARVIVLTTFDTDHEIHRAIKVGARAYLLKDAPREELLECIRKDRSRALHQRDDGEIAPAQYFHQAQRPQPHRSHRHREQARIGAALKSRGVSALPIPPRRETCAPRFFRATRRAPARGAE